MKEYNKEDVEDVFALSFEFTFDRFGEKVVHELIPNGSNIEVTHKNKKEYIYSYIKYILHDSVEKYIKAVKKGFDMVINVDESPALILFRARELELILIGTSRLDFEELEDMGTEYEGYTPESKVIQFFWDVVKKFDDENQRKFLKFVSGSPRAPVGGLKELKFKIQRAGPDSELLPTSATCFTTLLLPEYSSKAKLKEKLTIAIENSLGFGFD